MPLDAVLQARIAVLTRQGLLRSPGSGLRERAGEAAKRLGVRLIDASSNDYLGLSELTVSRETSGAGASRLLNGTRPAHDRLERALADWLEAESVLLFSSGYAANVGVLSALVGPGETLLSDALNHASIIDGSRLSRGAVQIYPHGDLAELAAGLSGASRPAWVATESYFSMDADSPDLGAMRRLCDASEAFLVVDEAHSLGVFGPEGRGLSAAAGVRPDVLVGTFGKAFGVHGAFVAGSQALRDFLWNRARSFVFSTATSPALAATVLERLELVVQGRARRERLAAHAARLAEALRAVGLTTPPGRHGPIFPVLLGSPESALAAAEHLADHGILAPAIRPPTVPEGTSRLRITLTAGLDDHDVSRAIEALRSLPR